ncbi:MAG TPA: hypothetical protein VM344_10890 [Vitreimonas sp.]|nr:hypothetical protein [Vitreimonas sp.]
MPEPHPSHQTHDQLLVAAHVAGDTAGRDLDEAQRLLAGCPSCAELAADLRALARASSDLPTPVRSRDFRLSPNDAARLRRGGWRRFVGVLAGPRFAFAQPLGAAVAALGLAGFLFVALPGVPLGSAGAAPLSPVGREVPDAAPYAATAPAPENGAAGAPLGGEDRASGGDAQGGETSVDDNQAQPAAGGSPQPGKQAPDPDAPAAEPPGDGAGAEGQGGVEEGGGRTSARDAQLAQASSDTTLAILSGSFLIIGLGLFGLRWTARRLGDG